MEEICTTTGLSWERQPGETEEEYSLFSKFLELPPAKRNIRTLSIKSGEPVAKLTSIAIRWRWLDRSRDYDSHTVEQVRAALAGEIYELCLRAVQAAQEVINVIESKTADIPAESALDIERLSRAVATLSSIIQQVTSPLQQQPQAPQITIQNVFGLLDELARALPPGVIVPGSMDRVPLLPAGPEGPDDR